MNVKWVNASACSASLACLVPEMIGSSRPGTGGTWDDLVGVGGVGDRREYEPAYEG